MSRIVIDASVALSWCFPDEGGAYGGAVLELLVETEALVPAIWPLEVGNAILVAERRKRIGAAEVRRFIALLEGLAIVVDNTGAGRVFREVLKIAQAESLSSYDSAYLELAIQEDVPLATLDAGIRTAAANLGVPVVTG